MPSSIVVDVATNFVKDEVKSFSDAHNNGSE